MLTKEYMKQVYIDTSVLEGWFIKLMKEEDPEDIRIIKFLRNHEEIKAFISPFTVAEIIESLLSDNSRIRIRPHMRNYENIKAFTKMLLETTGLNVLKYETKDGKPGFFMSHRVADYTAICKSVKDTIHVCIAEHENLCFVTHDIKIPLLKSLYEKIITDTHLIKAFEKE